MEMQFIPQKILNAVLSKIWVIAAAAILAGALGMFIGNPNAADMYAAEVSLYSASRESYRDSMEGVSTMLTYAEIAKSRKIAAAAMTKGTLSELSPEEIMKMTSVSFSEDSSVLKIRITDTDPQRAVTAANAVAQAFVNEISAANASDSVQILDPALRGELYSRGLTGAIKFCIVFVFFCVFMATSLIVLMSMLDQRVAFPREVTLEGEIELIAAIPEHGQLSDK